MSSLSPLVLPIPNGRANVYSNGYIYWTTRTWWDNKSGHAWDNRRIISKVTPYNEKLMFTNKWYMRT